MNRPTILTFLDHYLPGYRAGGPIRTVSNMVDQLSDFFQFNIVASDRDVGDTSAYSGVTVDRWIPLERSNVFYRSPGIAGWRALQRELEQAPYDMVYLGGLFSGRSSFGPLVAMRLGLIKRRATLLAPRGELSPGALSIRPLKKRAFLNLAQLNGLYDGVSWHCSNSDEAKQVTEHVSPQGRVFIAPDLSGSSKIVPAKLFVRKQREPLRIIFLSRISPKKNLAGALEIIKRVRHPIKLSIYGPREDVSYWQACVSKISTMPDHVAVDYCGEAHPDSVEKLFSEFDLFLFPTFGENYGHVIREALSSGLPSLISDRTPWRDLQAKGAGADLPLDDLDAFAQWIDEFAELGLAEREEMREAARKLGYDLITAAANLEANRSMLAAVLSGGYLPSAKRSRHV